MENKKDILLCMYQEHLNQARHQENQRSSVTNLILILCSALLSFVSLDKAISVTELPIAAFIFLLGLFGAFFNSKYYERFKLHYERSRVLREKLDKLFNDLCISELQKEADNRTKKQHPIIFNFRLHWLWIFFMLSIASIGLFLIIFFLVTNVK